MVALEGRIACITGGMRRAFPREGAELVINGRDEVKAAFAELDGGPAAQSMSAVPGPPSDTTKLQRPGAAESSAFPAAGRRPQHRGMPHPR